LVKTLGPILSLAKNLLGNH